MLWSLSIKDRTAQWGIVVHKHNLHPFTATVVVEWQPSMISLGQTLYAVFRACDPLPRTNGVIPAHPNSTSLHIHVCCICSTWTLWFIGVLLFIIGPADCSSLCQWRWSSWHCESVTWERRRSQHTWQGEWCVDYVWGANIMPWVPLNGDLTCVRCFKWVPLSWDLTCMCCFSIFIL